MEYRNSRKEVLFYAAAVKEFKETRAINIFFRQAIMVRCIASYLGPSGLEYHLKQLKSKLSLFYMRNELIQREIDKGQKKAYWRHPVITQIYVAQNNRNCWYLDNIDTCAHNLQVVDSRKESVTSFQDLKLYDCYGYITGRYELELFITDTGATHIDKESILKFISYIVKDIESCNSQNIFYNMRRFESKLNFLSSFLKHASTLNDHISMRIY